MRINSDQVEDLIPHRAPFIFVESAEITGSNEITGICNWKSDNPVFLGHFPSMAVVPGVLLVESVAQLTGVFLAHQVGSAGDFRKTFKKSGDMIGVLIGVKRASFHKPVFPMDRIRFRVTIGNPIAGMISASAEGQDDQGKRVCKCEVSIAIVERGNLIRGAGESKAESLVSVV